MLLDQQAAPVPKHHKKQKAHTVQPPKQDPPPAPAVVASSIFGGILVLVWIVAIPVCGVLVIWAFWMFVFKSIGKAFRRGQLEADRLTPKRP